MSARLEFFTAQLTKFQASGEPLRIIKSLRAPWLTTPKQRIVVLDSSFNPPTLAHLYMAQTALRGGETTSGGGTFPSGTTSTTTSDTSTTTTTSDTSTTTTTSDTSTTTTTSDTSTTTTTSDTSSSSGTESAAGATGLLLLLAVNNADKAPKPAPFVQRLCMMDAFAEDLLAQASPTQPASIAIGLTTLPYFHAKASALAALSSSSSSSSSSSRSSSSHASSAPPPEQIYLAGFDTLVRIFNTQYYASPSAMHHALSAFFARARLLITVRADDEWGSEDAQRAWLRRNSNNGPGPGPGAWADRVAMVPGVQGAAVSSTAVRAAAQREDGVAVRAMVSARVAEWMAAEGLYQS